MIKSDRFWHRIIKFKTVAGLRRSLICSNSKAFNLWQGWGLRICNSNFAQLLHCIQRSYYAAATPLLDRQLLVLSLGRLWRPSSNSINGRLRVENVLSSLASLRSAPHAFFSCLCYLYNFPLAMKYLPCHSINSSKVELEEGGKSQLSDRLKPATVLNLIIRCQKRSLLIISLFFNDKVTLLYS